MRRRDFALTLAASALAGRAAAEAPPALIVGLSPDTTEFAPDYAGTPLRETLLRSGRVEGRDYVFVSRSTHGDNAALPAAARELVARNPRVFLAFGDEAIRAAQAATKTIPIAAIADDMVGSHLVASFARPGGNTTGVSLLASELDAKRLTLLHELVPAAAKIGVLADPTTVSTRAEVERAARELGLDLAFATATTEAEGLGAIRGMAASGAKAVNICASPILYVSRYAFFDLTAQLRLPAIYQAPENAHEGGLVGYGPPFSECYTLLTQQAIKLLDGAKPADLPIEQPTKFELVINLKAAKALGLTVPPLLLARADEVIE
jgi:putative ABC transport system substrate-binding protein